MASYVGVDLHRRRSVIVVLDEAGDRVWSSRIENSRWNLELELRAIVDAVDAPVEVVIEATWGWYWAADVVEEVGLGLHLVQTYMALHDGQLSIDSHPEQGTIVTLLLPAERLGAEKP